MRVEWLLLTTVVVGVEGQCESAVSSGILAAHRTVCASIAKALRGEGLKSGEWKVLCTRCVPRVNEQQDTFFSTCTSARETFRDIQDACGACGNSSQTCPVCPTPVPTVDTPSPDESESGSSSGSSVGTVELTGPITTIFIVGVVIIVCVVASGIWYCYIRKTPKEKLQEQKLRNYNLLDLPHHQKEMEHSPIPVEAPPSVKEEPMLRRGPYNVDSPTSAYVKAGGSDRLSTASMQHEIPFNESRGRGPRSEHSLPSQTRGYPSRRPFQYEA